MRVRKRFKPQRRLRPKRSLWKKVLKSRFFWFGLLGLFALGGAAYGVFFTPVFQIKHIEVQGAQKVPAEKLQEIAKEHILQKFLLFEINNVFFANVSKVSQEAEAAFPEIETIRVDTGFPDKVKITVQERGAVATWCQEKAYTVGEGEEQVTRSFRECFALDSGGVIFEQRELEGEMLIQNGGEHASLGDQVIDPETLEEIFEFQQTMDSSALFQDVGLRVSLVNVISDDRVNAGISEGWELYFNPSENIHWQTTKAQLVLKEEVPAEKRPLLEYIDLRFGDQAYIKYKN